MKNDNKVYALFAAASAIASNYFILRALYGDPVDNHYLVVWINSLFWILIAILFYKGKLSNKKIQNVLFAISCAGLIFVCVVFLDRMVGVFFVSQPEKGLIFEPNTRAVYSTSEFTYEAQINSIGLRDREVATGKSSRIRILCFGDSFTYGWGVNLEDSWPKVLENYLNRKGLETEVINCGQGNQYTTTYKLYIKKAVPLLKPDIVLVGVLQLDDLAQLYENHFPVPTVSPNMRGKLSIKQSARKLIELSFRNCLYIMDQKKRKTAIAVTAVWKDQVTKMLASFDRLESLRYQTFEDGVKQMFETGNLNPGLLSGYMKFPDRNIVFNNPEHPATKFAIEKMKSDFAEMAKLCSENKCKLVFVNIPVNIFTGHVVHRVKAFDDIESNYFYNNNKIDSIYRDIASEQGIPYFEMTEIFKSLRDKDKYFFLYDGHPNKAGYRVLGESIGNFLLARIMAN
jgi:lysophospholipase L1-like esterase